MKYLRSIDKSELEILIKKENMYIYIYNYSDTYNNTYKIHNIHR